MNVKVLIFVSGIIQILGRPITENCNTTDQYGNIENRFLLPAVFNVNDEINITIHITEKCPEEIYSIDFMGEDNNDKSKDVTFFSIKTDLQYFMISKGSDENVSKHKMGSVVDDGEKMVFNIWVQRRENKQDEENNVIQVNTKYESPMITVDNIENIRYLKVTGGKAKMLNLGFKFA